MTDSRVGKYVGFGEYDMRNAAHYNSQAWKMAESKRQVETLCRYDARLFRRSTLDRLVPPVVKEVRVSWLRDGAEVDADVSSTDTLADGDWSFQLHSYLELTPRRGERVSCRVDHSSLRTSLEVDWDTSSLDAKYLKMTVGIICFFLGFTAAAGGAAYYWWKQRFAFRPLGSQGHTSPRHPSELLIF
ncbi:hypothetical protein VZT92_027758 [Zoarces viviparus]|uniref:Immunoglobulin C1-set domain-containing protein n=1 Tax=Zoarces viviparus TaxID=48416 RepID=A0AAW1DV68_ZOAVI